MFSRMIWLVCIILFLWFIAMHFIWDWHFENSFRVKTDTVALAFNGGPNIPYTHEIIEILNKNNINATFFVFSEHVQKHPEIINEAYKAGNAIACLGMNYPNQTEATLEQIKVELANCKKIIKNIIGKSPVCYQPISLKLNPQIQKYIESQNMVIIYEDVDSTDTKSTNANDIVNNTLSLIGPKSLITLHDGSYNHENSRTTVDALPILIEKIKKMGLNFSIICQS